MRDATSAPDRPPWIGTLIASGLWILWSIPALMFPQMSGEQVWLAFGISAVALAVALAVGGIGHFVTHRLLRATGPVAMALVRALAGVLAGGTLIWLVALVDFPAPTSSWVLVLVPMLAAPWVIDTISRITAVRQEVLTQRQALIDQAVDLMASNSTQQSVIEDVRSTIATSVEAELAPVRSEVARQLRSLQDANSAPISGSQMVSAAAHDSVRPLVRLLTSPQVAAPEPIGIWGSVRAIIQTQPFHPVPLAIIYVLVNAPTLIEEGGFPRGFVDVVVGVALIFVILMLGNAAMRRGHVRHDVAFLTTFAILQLPTVAYVLATTDRGGEVFVGIVTSAVVSFLLVLMTSSLGSWRQRQESAQQTFRDLLAEEQIAALARTRVAADVARQAAHTLHGPVQARLAACAVAMEQAGRAGDVELYGRSLEEARDALEMPLFADEDTTVETIAGAITRASQPWLGLVQVTTRVDPRVATADDLGSSIAKVVEEGITNAVRHGRAQSILIVVDDVNGELIVEIHDDGSGVEEGSPGLGSRLLNRVSSGRWHLGSSALLGGAVLTVPIRASGTLAARKTQVAD